MKNNFYQYFIFWFTVIVGVTIGLLLSYCIHFQWNYFGAKFVTVRDVVGNWIGCPVASGTLFAILYVYCIEKNDCDV